MHGHAGETEWREQIVLARGRGEARVDVRVHDAAGEERGAPGYVIVFDDITALLQAQRDAAWGEVARRLAHEIKNPLTPIQLSAERLRRRYLAQMSAEDAQILDRATHTIVQQVEAMKEMVNAFSEYARAPDMKLTALRLNALVTEVVDLYRAQERGVQLDVSSTRHRCVDADPGRCGRSSTTSSLTARRPSRARRTGDRGRDAARTWLRRRYGPLS